MFPLMKLDGKYSERVQLPAKAKFGFFGRQHLATLATPILLDIVTLLNLYALYKKLLCMYVCIRSIKCKQSPVYGVF